MACPAIITGDNFLLRTLGHIDCQAQLIGSYGYLALGQPGSPAALLVSGLLTLFIALFGIRLLFGPAPGARDIVYDVLRIGIVLTLAFSWPAFRTVIYDVTLKGPAEVVAMIGAADGQAAAGSGLAQRLQRADNAIVRLTEAGAGRNTGALIDRSAAGGSFAGTALGDDTAFGWGRLMFLAGTIGTLALLRIAAGLLLAITPLLAGLFLFTWSRGLVAGWLRGLVLTFAGSAGMAIVLSVELAILEPWLTDALRLRSLGYAIPAAPTELFAITLAFVIVQLAMIWLLARVVFNRGWPDLPRPERLSPAELQPLPRLAGGYSGEPARMTTTRAEQISTSVEAAMRREQGAGRDLYLRNAGLATSGPPPLTSGVGAAGGGSVPRLGSSYRRSSLRSSRAGRARDRSR